MNHNTYADWCDSVNELNRVSREVIMNRREVYDYMAQFVKGVFKKHLKKSPDVHIEPTGKIITVTLSLFECESIRVSSDLLDELLMPVCIRPNEDKLIFELYPDITDASKVVANENILKGGS